MEKFESQKHQNRETGVSLDFQIKNLKADIESLAARFEQEKNPQLKVSIEAQIRNKMIKLEDTERRFAEIRERQEGAGHA